MIIPQPSLLEAFAIGLPFGVAGFFAQEAVLRRRRMARAPAEPHPTAPARPGPERTAPERPGRRSKAEVQAEVVPGSSPSAAPEPIVEPVVASSVETPASAPAAPAAAPKRSGATALRKSEAMLDSAIEVIVDFVDGQARRARAQACADALTGLVPRARRGPAFVAFVAAVKENAAPGKLQEMAEDAGVELAIALRVVREELETKT